MRAHGHCLLCHRIKRINIRPSQASERIPYGECDDCIDRRQAQQKAASESSHRSHRKDKK